MKIYTEIENKLKNIADRVIETVNTNEVFEPTIGKPWVRVTLMPGRSSTMSLGYDHMVEYQGLYRIDVFIDKSISMDVGNRIVDDLIVEYKAHPLTDPEDFSTFDDDVRMLIGDVWRETARFEKVWVNIPVYVSWKTHIRHNQ